MSIWLAGTNWTMSPRYLARGRDDRPILKPGATVTQDEFGADVLTLEANVRTDLVEQYLPQKGDLDPIHQKLAYRSRTITHGEGWRSIIRAEFNAILTSRDAKREASVGERSVTLRNGTELQVTLLYLNPRAAFYYAVPNDPQRPSHRGELIPSALDFEIVEIRANDVDLTGVVTLQNLTDAGYGHEYVTRTTTFTRKEEGGVWRCTEENEGIIIASY